MSQRELVTREGLELLRQKIDEIRSKLEELRRSKGAEAVQAGDSWFHNSILYRIEAEERSLMLLLAELNQKLRHVEVVEIPQGANRVSFGCKVEIRFSDGCAESYRILSEAEANPSSGIISYKSPLASALIGKEAGDRVAYRVGAVSEEVEILSIGV